MSKYIPHILFAIGTTVVCVLCINFDASLVKDLSATLGTIGFFATAYGVIFAIIELKRAKSAAEFASSEVGRVLNSVTCLVTAREITECQALVQNLLGIIDDKMPVSTATINHVIRIYSQIFFKDMKIPQSLSRNNRAILENASITSSIIHGTSATNSCLRQALHSITGQLAELQGSTNNFTESFQ